MGQPSANTGLNWRSYDCGCGRKMSKQWDEAWCRECQAAKDEASRLWRKRWIEERRKLVASTVR